MTVMQETETFVIERVINASQETLFELWTETEKIKTWLVDEAELDARPGGVFNLRMGGKVVEGEKASKLAMNGHFLVLEPHDHLEFTWGFAEERIGVPQDSSTVAVDFIPEGEGTLVRISHSGLPAGRDSSPFSERNGWNIMIEHLEKAATTETIVVERVIKASQQTLFEMWTDAEKISSWLSTSAKIDPREGGEVMLEMGRKVDHPDAPFVNNGHFLAFDPYSHLELTWGFEAESVGLAPESSTVAVDFIPQGDATLVRVSHSGLPIGRDGTPFSERAGWNAFLDDLQGRYAA
jgi:uncharacterized protein YndB with AHSA1/START domain